MPSIEAATSLPASTTDTVNILWSLTAGISGTSEEAEHQKKIPGARNASGTREARGRKLIWTTAAAVVAATAFSNCGRWQRTTAVEWGATGRRG